MVITESLIILQHFSGEAPGPPRPPGTSTPQEVTHNSNCNCCLLRWGEGGLQVQIPPQDLQDLASPLFWVHKHVFIWRMRLELVCGRARVEEVCWMGFICESVIPGNRVLEVWEAKWCAHVSTLFMSMVSTRVEPSAAFYCASANSV